MKTTDLFPSFIVRDSRLQEAIADRVQRLKIGAGAVEASIAFYRALVLDEMTEPLPLLQIQTSGQAPKEQAAIRARCASGLGEYPRVNGAHPGRRLV